MLLRVSATSFGMAIQPPFIMKVQPDRLVGSCWPCWLLVELILYKYFRLLQTICVCTYANWYLQSIQEVVVKLYFLCSQLLNLPHLFGNANSTAWLQEHNITDITAHEQLSCICRVFWVCWICQNSGSLTNIVVNRACQYNNINMFTYPCRLYHHDKAADSCHDKFSKATPGWDYDFIGSCLSVCWSFSNLLCET